MPGITNQQHMLTSNIRQGGSKFTTDQKTDNYTGVGILCLLSEEFRQDLDCSPAYIYKEKENNKCFRSWRRTRSKRKHPADERNPTILCRRINKPHQGWDLSAHEHQHYLQHVQHHSSEPRHSMDPLFGNATIIFTPSLKSNIHVFKILETLFSAFKSECICLLQGSFPLSIWCFQTVNSSVKSAWAVGFISILHQPSIGLQFRKVPAPASLLAGLAWLVAVYQVLCRNALDLTPPSKILTWPTRGTKLSWTEQMVCKGILAQEGQAVLMTFPKACCLVAKNITSKIWILLKDRKGGLNSTVQALVNVKNCKIFKLIQTLINMSFLEILVGWVLPNGAKGSGLTIYGKGKSVEADEFKWII